MLMIVVVTMIIMLKVMIIIARMTMMIPTNRDSPLSGDAMDRASCYCFRASSVSQDISDLLTEVLQKERLLLLHHHRLITFTKVKLTEGRTLSKSI
jgi:hypothetical protein